MSRRIARTALSYTFAGALTAALVSAPVQASPVLSCPEGTQAAAVTSVTRTGGELDAVPSSLAQQASTTTWLDESETPSYPYVVTVCRDAAAGAYYVYVQHGSGDNNLEPRDEGATFRVTFTKYVADGATTSADQATVADGVATYTDFSTSAVDSVVVAVQPVAYSDVPSCDTTGDRETCADTATAEDVVDYPLAIAARVHFATSPTDALHALTNTTWSAPSYISRVVAACPTLATDPYATGARFTLVGPRVRASGVANTVDSQIVLPAGPLGPLVRCWGVTDPDTFNSNVVVTRTDAGGTRVLTRSETPNGVSEFGVASNDETCDGVCIALADAQIQAATFSVMYSYASLSTSYAQRRYLSSEVGKKSKATKRSMRSLRLSLRDGSSPACVLDNGVIRVTRTAAHGGPVLCQYRLTFKRVVGGKLRSFSYRGQYRA